MGTYEHCGHDPNSPGPDIPVKSGSYPFSHDLLFSSHPPKDETEVFGTDGNPYRSDIGRQRPQSTTGVPGLSRPGGERFFGAPVDPSSDMLSDCKGSREGIRPTKKSFVSPGRVRATVPNANR